MATLRKWLRRLMHVFKHDWKVVMIENWRTYWECTICGDRFVTEWKGK